MAAGLAVVLVSSAMMLSFILGLAYKAYIWVWGLLF